MDFEALMNDKEFAGQVAKAADADEVVALFAARGVEIPREIAQELFDQPEAELSEDELEDAAGGLIGYLYWRVIKGRSRTEAADLAWDVYKNGANGQGKNGVRNESRVPFRGVYQAADAISNFFGLK